MDLGRRIKSAVTAAIGPAVKVSIGLAPSRYVAKVALIMRKPDGLFLIDARQLLGILHSLELRDLPGVVKNMEVRLRAAGIHTVELLCAAPSHAIHALWGGILASR